jgi:uncharacterized CHY-type Zn-finger protein
MKPLFCPRCHKRVEPPPFLKTGKVKAEGKITIGCGNCKKGKVVLTAQELDCLDRD